MGVLANIPNGYIPGLDRNDKTAVAHLYHGDFADPGMPMCARGWNRAFGFEYSIFRNNVGSAGICRVCLRRAREGRPPVPPKPRETKWL